MIFTIPANTAKGDNWGLIIIRWVLPGIGKAYTYETVVATRSTINQNDNNNNNKKIEALVHEDK